MAKKIEATSLVELEQVKAAHDALLDDLTALASQNIDPREAVRQLLLRLGEAPRLTAPVDVENAADEGADAPDAAPAE